jgi:hypothetical protein
MKEGNVMKKNLKWQIAIASGLTLLFAAAAVSAQSISQSAADANTLLQAVQATQTARGGGGSVGFTTIVNGGKTVTNAPYSAQIVTESVQPFADGNNITHKSVSSVWRDSQGRTRREQNINMIGPAQASSPSLQFITIDDPVAGVHYTLNPNKMTATQFTLSGSMAATTVSSLPRVTTGGGGDNVSFSYSIVGDGATASAGGRGGSMSVTQSNVSADNVTTESLGADTMEGLSVLGTRVTRTIPEGQIGNALPILIITDKWYSQDLQIEMKTVHSDPRTGTTTTTVTHLSRTEPPISMFTLPAGYTVTTGGGRGGNVILKPTPQEPLQ